jgi:OmpA-OmpF porin, OOP family
MKYTVLFIAAVLMFLSGAAQSTDPESVGKGINSPYNEMNPVLHPDGKTMYFTRSNHPENIGGRRDKGDIWVSVLGEDGWQPATNIGEPLNNAEYNAVVGFSADGRTMFLHNVYTREYRPLPIQGISVSYRRGSSWSYPVPVPIQSFYNRSDHQSVSLSHDGRVMVMAIESYATYGVEDIYVSFLRSNGEWTHPLNLGPDINTNLQEMTPTLLKDNKTLIFASNGHGGYGSMDLFYSERLDDTWTRWSKPQNLGPAVNTRGRETYYFVSPDEEYAYFVSTQNSEGYGDIKRIRLGREDLARQVEAVEAELVEEETEVVREETERVREEAVGTAEVPVVEPTPETIAPPVITASIEGRIVNVKSNETIPARIVFIPINVEGQNQVDEDAARGLYKVHLKPGTYMAKASAAGFMSYEEEVHIGTGTMTRNFELSPLDVGAVFTLNNVLFTRGTIELLESSFQELDQIVEVLKTNPSVKIELAGHTDNQGSARLNMRLSQERVETVKNYLVQKGIDSSRITGKGYGGSRPIASNNSEETRRLNRRVEFTVVQN